MYMKLRIQQLEFDLETEKIRSRHFEGLSEIAMLELKRGHWVNSSVRRKKLCDAFGQVDGIRLEISNSLQKLENIVSLVKNELE
jgi:hypothetical protein